MSQNPADYTYRDGMAWDPPMRSYLQVQVRSKQAPEDPYSDPEWVGNEEDLTVQVSAPGLWRVPALIYTGGLFYGNPEIGLTFDDGDGPYGSQYRYRFNDRYYTALPMKLKWRELIPLTQADLGYFSATIPAGGAWSDWLSTTPEAIVTEIRSYAGPYLPLFTI